MLINEIEKLYNNVGIEKLRYCFAGCKYAFCNSCDDCNVADKMVYPPFTAEKQIELIKWISDIRDYTVEIEKFKGNYYVGCRSAVSNNKYWGSHNIFEEALAELVNACWKDLTEEQKQQVKEILEQNV